MRVLWLAQVLRDAGLAVVEHGGWRDHGWQPWEPKYGIVHATAAPRSQSDADQVRIVRDGRSDLNGPIANCCVDRLGRWHVLASGRCNTALTGWGGPANGLGNTNLLGVEACNDNGLAQPPEPWPDVQYEAYAAGWAAICRRMGWPASRCVGHKEHQPGNKSDPTFNMDTFRRRVAAYIEEGDMPTAQEIATAVVRELGEHRFPRADGKEGGIALPTSADWARHHAGGAKTAVAELAGRVDGLAVLVQQLAAMPPVPLTGEQLAELTNAVTQAAAGAAEAALERTRLVVGEG